MTPSRILIAMIALCLASPAAAEDRAAAEQFFRLGAEAYKDGQFEAAATNFDRAYENFKAPEIAFSAAQAHRLQFQGDRNPAHLKRAIELYEAYVAAAPTGPRLKDAHVYLERLRDTLSKIDPQQIRVAQEKPSIYVSIALENALLTIDGKPAERHTTIEVPPGEHVVAAAADGYFPQEQRIKVGDDRKLVAFELKPRPATLAVKSQADARITVDGRPVLLRGNTTEVAAGTRWVTVSARGRKPISREVVLEPGQQLSLDAPLQPTMQRRAVRWVWASAGALLAGTLATTTVALVADFRAADLRDGEVLAAGQEQRYEDLRERRDRFRTASFVLGSAALLTAAAATVMYYVDDPSADALLRPIERKPEGGFAPVALGGGGGIGLGIGYAGGF